MERLLSLSTASEVCACGLRGNRRSDASFVPFAPARVRTKIFAVRHLREGSHLSIAATTSHSEQVVQWNTGFSGDKTLAVGAFLATCPACRNTLEKAAPTADLVIEQPRVTTPPELAVPVQGIDSLQEAAIDIHEHPTDKEFTCTSEIVDLMAFERGADQMRSDSAPELPSSMDWEAPACSDKTLELVMSEPVHSQLRTVRADMSRMLQVIDNLLTSQTT